MSGHSHAKNIMHVKNASDTKKAKIFNKIAREIMVSVKLGAPEPEHNPRLRAAIIEARGKNMPRERIERAIKAGQGNTDGKTNYEEVRYEGYGPGGAALIIEALTDNRNRTAADLRTALSKNGGTMGETGSVNFMFERVGEIVYPADKADADTMFEAVIEAGGDDVESDEDGHYITTSVEAFGPARAALEAKFGEPLSAKLTWDPKTPTPLEGDVAAQFQRLYDILEDNDDVQNLFTNADIAEA